MHWKSNHILDLVATVGFYGLMAKCKWDSHGSMQMSCSLCSIDNLVAKEGPITDSGC